MNYRCRRTARWSLAARRLRSAGRCYLKWHAALWRAAFASNGLALIEQLCVRHCVIRFPRDAARILHPRLVRTGIAAGGFAGFGDFQLGPFNLFAKLLEFIR